MPSVKENRPEPAVFFLDLAICLPQVNKFGIYKTNMAEYNIGMRYLTTDSTGGA
jgi:hypothetical protein